MTSLPSLAQAIAVAPQSALEPGGPAAARIAWLWDLMLWSGTAITLLVVVLLLVGLLRRRRSAELPPIADSGESARRGTRWMLAGGVALPTVVLTALFALNLDVLGVTYPQHNPPAALRIEVTGHQWWWEVRYLDSVPARIVRSANEIHLPVGQRVRLELRAKDVIHSFWVPGLHGKLDMLPGRTNALWLQADTAGVWRGQCAEYCGLQHARMGLVVVAEPKDSFARWLENERAPAAEPADSTGRLGRATFLGSPCATCHAVRGTSASATVGPDLTHVASRRTLAAGDLPNTRGNLYGWIADPQSLKPGSRMPRVGVTTQELHLIVEYVGSLR
jgi:cytochrome c oxidase subunit 2